MHHSWCLGALVRNQAYFRVFLRLEIASITPRHRPNYRRIAARTENVLVPSCHGRLDK